MRIKIGSAEREVREGEHRYTIHYRATREIGRFEGDAFDPEQWRARVPVGAVLRARDDDTFWAALRVMAFTDDMIRAAVQTAEFGDPAAEHLLAEARIAVVPGSGFGAPEFIRLSYATSMELIVEGLNRFESAARALRGAGS